MAMTPPERTALLFLATLLALGTATRVVSSRRDRVPVSESARAELDAHIAAVDSARNATTRSARSGKRRPRGGARALAAAARDGNSRSVDLDVAGVAQIEALPGIGPVLASRIVADRDSLGPFGSFDELSRVKGVGPALLRRLETKVTFSGAPRPHNAVMGRRFPGVPLPVSKVP